MTFVAIQGSIIKKNVPPSAYFNQGFILSAEFLAVLRKIGLEPANSIGLKKIVAIHLGANQTPPRLLAGREFF